MMKAKPILLTILSLLVGVALFWVTIGYYVELVSQENVGEQSTPLTGLADDAWINSAPLTEKDLEGKVVLFHFWTFGCGNSIRSLPYAQDIWDKYKSQGLVVVGVHTPEFDYEKDFTSLKQAVQQYGLTYPIVNDLDGSNWWNYGGRYWPRAVVIGKDGIVKLNIVGELGYDRVDAKIASELEQ